MASFAVQDEDMHRKTEFVNERAPDNTPTVPPGRTLPGSSRPWDRSSPVRPQTQETRTPWERSGLLRSYHAEAGAGTPAPPVQNQVGETPTSPHAATIPIKNAEPRRAARLTHAPEFWVQRRTNRFCSRANRFMDRLRP